MEPKAKNQTEGLRRPLAVAGFSLFFTLCFLFLFSSPRGAAVLAILSGGCLFAALCLKKRRLPGLRIASGAVLGACLVFLCALRFVSLPALSAAGTQADISATVVSFPLPSAGGDRVYVTARLTADGERLPGKARLSLPIKKTKRVGFAADLRPGDTVTFSGTLYSLGGTNSALRRSFQSRRLFLGAYPTGKAERTVPEKPPLWARFLMLRQDVISALHSRFPGDTGGLLISLLFGEKTYLSPKTYRDFRNAGAAHLLAVSGLHLSIWVLGLFTLLRRRNVPLRVSALLSMGVTVLVMASALFTGSVLRAGFMLLVCFAGFLLRRRSDGLNSLGLAVSVCLLLDPFLAGNAGFLLSVLSTAALLLLAFPLSEKLVSLARIKRPRPRRLFGAFCVSVCVSLCVAVVTAPLQVFFFGSVSLVGALTNLLFLPLTTPLLLCAALSALLGGLPLLGPAVCLPARAIALLAIQIVRRVSSLPFAALSAEKIHAVPALVCSLCLCALVLLLLSGLRRNPKRRLALLVSSVFLLVLSGAAVSEAGTARLVVLNAGEGSCVFLKQGNDAALLRFDCEPFAAAVAIDELEERGVDLRAAVLNGTANDDALTERLQPEEVFRRETAGECAFEFGDFRVRLLKNGVLLRGRGQTFFLSDHNTLALSAISGIIHTDAAALGDTLILSASKNGKLRLRGENDWHTLMKSSSKPT